MITKISVAVLAHFLRHRQRGRWSFFWRVTLEGLIAGISVAFLCGALDLPRRADLDSVGVWQKAALLVFVAPLLETLLFHALPVRVVRWLSVGFWWQVAAALVLFAAAHFQAGVASGVAAGVVGGFYFAFTYVHWCQISFRSAIWMTAGTHAVHNMVILGIVAVTGNL